MCVTASMCVNLYACVCCVCMHLCVRVCARVCAWRKMYAVAEAFRNVKGHHMIRVLYCGYRYAMVYCVCE
jgi:hypothetical protein